MKKISDLRSPRLLLIMLFTASISLAAYGTEQKFALIMGNSNYRDFGKLQNPGHDAQDMAGILEKLGFSVNLVLDSDLTGMEKAVVNLGNSLAENPDSVGFFYYAGHGVQSRGENYLIPAGASIASEAFLRSKALAVQAVLDTLQSASNQLNIIILDACRDNPFGWSRSSTRGLSVVGNQPPGSIIVYSTSAGSVAEDGTGRNGLFTSELLKQLETPDIPVHEVFNRTGREVSRVSNGRQIPAIYSQYFDEYFLNGNSGGTAAARKADNPVVLPSTGVLLNEDYHKTLHFHAVPLESPENERRTEYLITSEYPYYTPFSKPQWNEISVSDICRDKGWSVRYVDNGTAFLMLGSTSASGKGSDIFHISIPTSKSVNVTGDSSLNYEYFTDYTEQSKRILFIQRNQSRTTTRIAGIDTSGIWYRESIPVNKEIQALVWKDNSAEEAWAVLSNQGDSQGEVWSWNTEKNILDFHFSFFLPKDARYMSVLDYSRQSQRLILKTGWNSPTAIILDLLNGTAASVQYPEWEHIENSSGRTISAVHWNPSGIRYIYRLGEGENVYAGIHDMNSGEFRPLPSGILTAFWFDNDSLGYFKNDELPGGKSVLHMYKAGSSGRGAQSVASFRGSDWFGLYGWALEENSAKACPFVYVEKADGEQIFAGETIRDARTSSNRKTDTLIISEALTDSVEKIIIQENLREISYLYSIKLIDDRGEVPCTISFSDYQDKLPYIIRQGGAIILEPRRKLYGSARLKADGFYTPEE